MSYHIEHPVFMALDEDRSDEDYLEDAKRIAYYAIRHKFMTRSDVKVEVTYSMFLYGKDNPVRGNVVISCTVFID